MSKRGAISGPLLYLVRSESNRQGEWEVFLEAFVKAWPSSGGSIRIIRGLGNSHGFGGAVIHHHPSYLWLGSQIPGWRGGQSPSLHGALWSAGQGSRKPGSQRVEEAAEGLTQESACLGVTGVGCVWLPSLVVSVGNSPGTELPFERVSRLCALHALSLVPSLLHSLPVYS